MEMYNHPEVYALNNQILELAGKADELEQAKDKLGEELYLVEQHYYKAKDELRQLVKKLSAK